MELKMQIHTLKQNKEMAKSSSNKKFKVSKSCKKTMNFILSFQILKKKEG